MGGVVSQDYAEAVQAAQETRCPRCKSPDTVSYWTKQDMESKSLRFVVIIEWYPNARKCVDCEHVWW